MPTEVKIPAMGESISSGILATWHVGDGDYVEKGQMLYELETDKITSEATAETAGVIRLKAAADDEVEIGQVVAEIDESAQPTSTGGQAPLEEAPQKQTSTSTCLPPSPAVRKLATEAGIDPASLAPGSGKAGRVTKGDLLKAIPQKVAPSPTTDHAPSTQTTGERRTRKKMSPIRKKIAQRLVAATQEAALLTTFNEVDMSNVMSIRKRYQEAFVAKYGVKLGFMSFFVKATVEALKAVPQVNVQIDGDTFVHNHFYDIGVAVGTDKGLVVPVVRECDQKNFAEIETSIIDYAQKARSNKITLEAMDGGVFTISNGGIYGSMLSTPLLNMPQSGILGLHNITQRAVVIDGAIVARPMMYLALSYDHRAVDGKEAVTFLVKIKEAIENPERMLFGV